MLYIKSPFFENKKIFTTPLSYHSVRTMSSLKVNANFPLKQKQSMLFACPGVFLTLFLSLFHVTDIISVGIEELGSCIEFNFICFSWCKILFILQCSSHAIIQIIYPFFRSFAVFIPSFKIIQIAFPNTYNERRNSSCGATLTYKNKII